jgi:agmatine deiminase
MAKLKVLDGTPTEMGYAFPAEWAPHAGTWLSWPRPEGASFPGRYETIPQNLAQIVRAIQSRERVHINVPNENWAVIVRQQLVEHGCPLGDVRFHYIATNENWCRDHGPAFVVRRAPRRSNTRGGAGPRSHGGRSARLAIVDWNFNSWGGKYPPYADDDAVPTRMAAELRLPVFRPGIVMEGGAVDFNGAGTVLTTESCLLNPNRNPDLSKAQIEQYLKDYYGQRHVCWLGEGIAGDDTDGHVDDLARFVDARTIVTAVEQDPADVNFGVLQDNLRRLRAMRDQDGRPFQIVTIPMPGVVEHNHQRLPATYVNFYFVNGALLVPIYRNRSNDRRAMEILQRLLPRHEIVGIDCVELIWGRGAIHCLTQQQPAV